MGRDPAREPRQIRSDLTPLLRLSKRRRGGTGSRPDLVLRLPERIVPPGGFQGSPGRLPRRDARCPRSPDEQNAALRETREGGEGSRRRRSASARTTRRSARGRTSPFTVMFLPNRILALGGHPARARSPAASPPTAGWSSPPRTHSSACSGASPRCGGTKPAPGTPRRCGKAGLKLEERSRRSFLGPLRRRREVSSPRRPRSYNNAAGSAEVPSHRRTSGGSGSWEASPRKTPEDKLPEARGGGRHAGSSEIGVDVVPPGGNYSRRRTPQSPAREVGAATPPASVRGPRKRSVVRFHHGL